MQALSNGIRRVSLQFSALSGFLTAFIILIVCLDVLSRALLGASINGGTELCILLLVGLVFLGLAGAEAKGENFSVTLLQGLVGERGWRILNVITRILSFGLVVFLAYFAVRAAVRSTIAGEASYGVIAFPVWPSRILVAVGLCFFALQILANLVTPPATRRAVSHD